MLINKFKKKKTRTWLPTFEENMIETVRLNFINHVLALFRDKFACNIAVKNMYLGGNHVRVVCERVWRNAQDCAVKQGLAAESRGRLAACKPPKVAHVQSMQGSWTVTPPGALHDKNPDWPFS